jgi:hypothetical protein
VVAGLYAKTFTLISLSHNEIGVISVVPPAQKTVHDRQIRRWSWPPVPPNVLASAARQEYWPACEVDLGYNSDPFAIDLKLLSGPLHGTGSCRLSQPAGG